MLLSLAASMVETILGGGGGGVSIRRERLIQTLYLKGSAYTSCLFGSGRLLDHLRYPMNEGTGKSCVH